MQNLVGVRIADATHNSRISQSTFQCAVLSRYCGLKRRQITGENIDAAWIHIAQALFASEHHQGSPAFGACFSEYERAPGKIERPELIAPYELCSHLAPVQAAGNHKVKHQPQI